MWVYITIEFGGGLCNRAIAQELIVEAQSVPAYYCQWFVISTSLSCMFSTSNVV